MRTIPLLLSMAAALSVGACVDSAGNRAIGGAVAGAVIADVTDNNVATGAVIGGLAGAASCTLPGQVNC
jgi:osmotically inducible lipoprotein OsmB